MTATAHFTKALLKRGFLLPGSSTERARISNPRQELLGSFSGRVWQLFQRSGRLQDGVEARHLAAKQLHERQIVRHDGVDSLRSSLIASAASASSQISSSFGPRKNRRPISGSGGS